MQVVYKKCDSQWTSGFGIDQFNDETLLLFQKGSAFSKSPE